MKTYKLVKERFQDNFEKKVSALLNEGYILHGSPSVIFTPSNSSDFLHIQALIKE